MSTQNNNIAGARKLMCLFCANTDKCPRAPVMLLFCGILHVFVRPSCKSIYRVYITKRANNLTPLPPVLPTYDSFRCRHSRHCLFNWLVVHARITGGQKSRVALADMALSNPDVIILVSVCNADYRRVATHVWLPCSQLSLRAGRWRERGDQAGLLWPTDLLFFCFCLHGPLVTHVELTFVCFLNSFTPKFKK